jgi:hypothetical protein
VCSGHLRLTCLVTQFSFLITVWCNMHGVKGLPCKGCYTHMLKSFCCVNCVL